MAKNFEHICWMPEDWHLSLTDTKTNHEALDQHILEFLHDEDEAVLKLASATRIAIRSKTRHIKNAPVVSFWKLKTTMGQPVLAALTELNNLVILPNEKAFSGLW